MRRIQGDDREHEIEDNLQAIDCMVANLRNMAVDMSAEITDQNEQLERIGLKVSSLGKGTLNVPITITERVKWTFPYKLKERYILDL